MKTEKSDKTEKTKPNKEKKRNKPRRGQEPVVADWQPLFAALKDVIDWALDIAVKLSRYTPEDVKAIEEVRRFVHEWLDGRPCEVPLTEVLLTFGTILSAIELDLGIDSASLLSPLHAMVSAPSRLPHMFRLPGVARDEENTVRIRRCPGAWTVRSYAATPAHFVA